MKHLAIIMMASLTTASFAGEFLFQNGVEGYTGGAARSIYSGGVVAPSRLRITGDPVTGAEVYNTLIRFNGLETLTDTIAQEHLVSAKLVLTFAAENVAWNEAFITIYPALIPWDNATWTKATADSNWAGAGASGSTDRGTMLTIKSMGKRNYFSGIQYAEGQVFLFEFPTALAAQWIANPQANYGLVLTMMSTAKSSVTFYGMDATDPELRPALLIETCSLLPGDLNQDCDVNMQDMETLIQGWMAQDGYDLEDYGKVSADWGCTTHADEPLIE